MASDQQFCLRWNNHQGNMVNVFDALLKENLLVDVTLACEGATLKAHKVVLSACSTFFQDIFVNNPCKHPVIVMNGMKIVEMRALLQFMYKGEVNVSQDQLSALLRTAETLKIKGLAEVDQQQQQQDSVTDKVDRFPRTEYSDDQVGYSQAQQVGMQQAVNPSPSSSSNVAINRRRTRVRRRSSSPPQVNNPKTSKISNNQMPSPQSASTSQNQIYRQVESYEQSPQQQFDSSPSVQHQFSSTPITSDLPTEPEIVHIKDDPDSPPDNTIVPEFIESDINAAELAGEQVKEGSENDMAASVNNDINQSVAFPDQTSPDDLFQDQSDLSMMQFEESGEGSAMMSFSEAGPSSGGSMSAANKSSTDDALKNANKGRFPQCPVCLKTFNTRWKCVVQRHMLAVHSNFRFRCDFCSQLFTYKSNLARHVRSMHSYATTSDKN